MRKHQWNEANEVVISNIFTKYGCDKALRERLLNRPDITWEGD